MIDLTNPDAVRAEAERRSKLRALGIATFTGSAITAPAVDEDALEKVVEHEGDKIMRALGFEVVRFSHPGRTKQTPGIPDRKYYHRRRGVTVWWEAKSATGRQRPDQREFQQMCEACGEVYLLGTHEALIGWLEKQCIARMVGNSLDPIPMREA